MAERIPHKDQGAGSTPAVAIGNRAPSRKGKDRRQGIRDRCAHDLPRSSTVQSTCLTNRRVPVRIRPRRLKRRWLAQREKRPVEARKTSVRIGDQRLGS